MENNNIEKIDQETLSAILKEHQLWLDSRGKNGERADLSNKSLQFANLAEANLARANLARANLRRANLRRANLHRADLHGADLEGVDLRRANLSAANLMRANLEGADLEGVYFRNAKLEGVNLERAKNTLFRINSDRLFTDNLQRKFQSSDTTIQDLEEKLKQAQSETVKNDEEIAKLKKQLNLEKSEKQKINDILNKRKEELRGRIKDAQKSLSEALKNTDKQIKNNEASASCFSGLGIVLFSIVIVLLIFFSMAVLFHPEYISEKKLNILFYTFPIITFMLIGTTCLRHQKNLLAEVRHFSNMKHQIELYSGLLEAS